ncbi:lytic murein transglycosylase [Streptomyces sp. NPDC047017]|uniref:lytic transglycosylase domain-containing protein n=1 Tax=Streptomyces sp. NPDC047017 TaxID=3155024 RepID=UPI0033D6B1C4
MPVRRSRRLRVRTRQGLRTTAVAVVAVAALTASQGPGLPGTGQARGGGPGGPAADTRDAPSAGDPDAASVPPGDGSYHTEIPPLITQGTVPTPRQATEIRAESGIPGTVLRAYRAAEASVARTDPGCRLPWQLLAAIGKVESGQAGGGAVDRQGTTLGRIAGPALDGRGFALVRDTDGGALDGDKVYDRAVGPMQFLPSTWARWGVDGNGDHRADPDNVFDAALAAGHYLCAGGRDLSRAADLDQAVLGYNDSDAYLRLVRYWLDFYRRGVHSVPDGKGVIPRSPGAGSPRQATKPVDGGHGGGGHGSGGKGGGGIVIGPDPVTPAPSHSAPSPTPSSSTTAPGTGPSPSGGTTSPSGSPTGGPSPTGSPGGSPTSGPSGSPTTTPCASPSASASADATGEPGTGPSTGTPATDDDPTCPPPGQPTA